MQPAYALYCLRGDGGRESLGEVHEAPPRDEAGAPLREVPLVRVRVPLVRVRVPLVRVSEP